MTPAAVAHLLAELVNLAAQALPAAEDRSVEAWVLFANFEVAFVHVAFDGEQEFEITVREVKHPRILKLEK
jgi:hypothetical protein